MYYFDYTPENDEYGTLQQQIWAVLHYPLHVALVVSAETTRQHITVLSFVQTSTRLSDSLMVAYNTESIQVVEALMQSMAKSGTSCTAKRYNKTDTEFLNSLNSNNYKSMKSNIREVFIDMYIGLTEYYGVKSIVPVQYERETLSNITVNEFLIGAESVANFVAKTLMISTGVVFLVYGLLGLFVRGRKSSIYDYVSVALRFAVAAGFLSMLALTGGLKQEGRTQENISETSKKFITSNWPLPTFALVILAGESFFPLGTVLPPYTKLRIGMDSFGP
jgi:hypothetical protein